MKSPNLFECLPADASREHFDTLLETGGLKLERIVSQGHATPKGEWYDQVSDEWVVLLKGSAGLRIDGETETRVLKPGDYLYLPAHVRHRVEWTEAKGETIWLALHHAG